MLELDLLRTSTKVLQQPRKYPYSLKKLWMYHF